MIQFPANTRKDTRLPKESFYSHLNITPTIKRSFVEDIDQIAWTNMLTADTLKIKESSVVKQIDVLTVTLKKKECNYKLFEVIEKAIPRHLLFILKYENDFRLLINYKEEYENVKDKYRLIDSFMTDWETLENTKLTLTGFDLERIYHNFVYQIAGNKLEKDPEKNLASTVEENQEIKKIKIQIAKLEEKMRKEEQFNIQIQLSSEIKRLKNQILNKENIVY